MRIKHVDGLRAVAVLAVVLFHAFPTYFPGGYLGVDYFLVISGFVISRKYFFNAEDRFDFSDFWRRRVKRLYPQLLCCILICIPFAFATMQPDYLENFSQSVIATLLGSNNILLFLTGGYWTIANEMKPLFTTWSLGLEEQFYLLASLALLFLGADKRNLKKVFLLLTVVSVLACLYGSIAFQKANFLLLPSRFWEFSLGITAGFLTRNKSLNLRPFILNLSLLISIACLLLPFDSIYYSPNLLFIFPLASIAIICAPCQCDCFSIKMLSFKPLCYLGLASYSIYLYHQPILAFARITSLDEISSSLALFLVVASFVAGILMYEIIECGRLLSMLSKVNISLPIGAVQYMYASFFLILFNMPVLVFEGLFNIRFPHLLVNGEPPEGFLGGKGYTDNPYKYRHRPYDNSVSSEKTRYSKILLIGNSQTRDLINSLEVLEKSLEHDFRYSYYTSHDDFLSQSNSSPIIKDASLIVVQGLHGNSKSSIPSYLKPYASKIISYDSRPRFVYNINPVLFLKDKERKGFSASNSDLIQCQPSGTVLPQSDVLFRIRSYCAFNNTSNRKQLADEYGSILTFDGEHLSKAGATQLANVLQKNKLFIDHLKESAGSSSPS